MTGIWKGVGMNYVVLKKSRCVLSTRISLFSHLKNLDESSWTFDFRQRGAFSGTAY